MLPELEIQTRRRTGLLYIGTSLIRNDPDMPELALYARRRVALPAAGTPGHALISKHL